MSLTDKQRLLQAPPLPSPDQRVRQPMVRHGHMCQCYSTNERELGEQLTLTVHYNFSAVLTQDFSAARVSCYLQHNLRCNRQLPLALALCLPLCLGTLCNYCSHTRASPCKQTYCSVIPGRSTVSTLLVSPHSYSLGRVEAAVGHLHPQPIFGTRRANALTILALTLRVLARSRLTDRCGENPAVTLASGVVDQLLFFFLRDRLADADQRTNADANTRADWMLQGIIE